MEGQDSIMDGASDSLFNETTMANSFIPTLMYEYMNAKYEEKSFQEITKNIQELINANMLDGVSAKLTERGLLLTFDDQYLFESGSATLNPKAKQMLDKVGVIVYEKFILHTMRVEGHTDSFQISTTQYPSNWELSSARSCAVVRYLIRRFNFFPQLFTAIGYADTRPAVDNNMKGGPEKNRRIEIMILKNKYKEAEKPGIDLKNLSMAQQVKLQEEREKIVRDIKFSTKMSDFKFKTNENESPKKVSSPYTKLPPDTGRTDRPA
jgi:chemotaxis protein MotB